MKIIKEEKFDRFDLYWVEYRDWTTLFMHKIVTIVYFDDYIPYCLVKNRLIPIAEYLGAILSLRITFFIADIENVRKLNLLEEMIKNELSNRIPGN